MNSHTGRTRRHGVVAGTGHVGSTCPLAGRRRSSVSISEHQWSSVVISEHQWSSVVLNGHQWSSVVISGHHLAGRRRTLMTLMMTTCSRRRHADRGAHHGAHHARAHHGAEDALPATPHSACTSASPCRTQTGLYRLESSASAGKVQWQFGRASRRMSFRQDADDP